MEYNRIVCGNLNIAYTGFLSIWERLEAWLNQYDKILFYESANILEKHAALIPSWSGSRKILFLSTGPFPLREGAAAFQRLTDEEAGEIKKLYFTYEFSDRFIFVSENVPHYPGLCQLVDTGLLSAEEALEALLWREGGGDQDGSGAL